jgi:hypothetical protein
MSPLRVSRLDAFTTCYNLQGKNGGYLLLFYCCCVSNTVSQSHLLSLFLSVVNWSLVNACRPLPRLHLVTCIAQVLLRYAQSHTLVDLDDAARVCRFLVMSAFTHTVAFLLDQLANKEQQQEQSTTSTTSANSKKRKHTEESSSDDT